MPVLLTMPASGNIALSLDHHVLALFSHGIDWLKTKLSAVSEAALTPLKVIDLPRADRDHRIAIGVVGQMGLNVDEALQIRKADQIDFVGATSKL